MLRKTIIPIIGIVLVWAFALSFTACGGGGGGGPLGGDPCDNGHDYSLFVSTTATCTAAGKDTFKCSRCTATDEQDRAALGHNMAWVTTMPITSLTALSETEACQRLGCGHKGSTQPITPALTFEDWLIAQSGGTLQNPINLQFAITDLGATQSMYSADTIWKQLLIIIEDAEKYVTLDLSDCTLPGTTFNPGSSNTYPTTGRKYITGLTLPNSATTIVAGVSNSPTFRGFINLKNLVANTAELPDYAFGNATTDNGVFSTGQGSSVTQIIFDGFTSIGNNAFQNCSSLTSITIPDSINSIGNSAFSGCRDLTNITIPDSITSIGDRAFQNCSGLTNITIPDSITSIGSSAFQNCTGLTSITIPDSVNSIGNSAFSGCTGLTNITIPDSITSISTSTFQNCSGLTNVTISANVVNINTYAFYNCTNLRYITFLGSDTLFANNNNDIPRGTSLYAAYITNGGGAGTYYREDTTWVKQ